MLTFNNDKKLKTILLNEIRCHRKADQIIQGTYGKENGNWRGCAVGCSIHSLNLKKGTNYETNDHSVYEKELGIPMAIAYLEDAIFERLPKEKAVLWPEQFIKAVPVGKDLSLVMPKFMVWLMSDIEEYAKDYSDVLTVLQNVKILYQRIIDGGTVSNKEWNEAARAAWGAGAKSYKQMADKLIEILEAEK